MYKLAYVVYLHVPIRCRGIYAFDDLLVLAFSKPSLSHVAVDLGLSIFLLFYFSFQLFRFFRIVCKFLAFVSNCLFHMQFYYLYASQTLVACHCRIPTHCRCHFHGGCWGLISWYVCPRVTLPIRFIVQIQNCIVANIQ